MTYKGDKIPLASELYVSNTDNRIANIPPNSGICGLPLSELMELIGKMKEQTQVLPKPRIRIPININDITKVIFNNPETIVIWLDGTKTVVKCQDGDTFNPEIGLAMCICKKVFGNNSKYNEVFNQWLPKENKNEKN